MPGNVGLSDSRAGLEQVCGLLLTPSAEALDAAAALLGSVVVEVAKARQTLGPGPPTEDYEGIRRAARLARILLDKASTYHGGWHAWIGSRAGGYGPSGQVAALVSRGRLTVEG
jgi:hypothetical protein